MKKITILVFLLLSIISYSQENKLLGKWEIYLNNEVDVSLSLTNDAKVIFLQNQTVVIIDEGKRKVLNWKLENGILSFNCTPENNFPRFCGNEYRIKFEEKESILILIDVSVDKSFNLKKINNSH